MLDFIYLVKVTLNVVMDSEFAPNKKEMVSIDYFAVTLIKPNRPTVLTMHP